MVAAGSESESHTALYDAVVIGAGPAGLSCALNLVRAHARVLLVDANRPRHAATLQSHGFLTRDGVAPAQLRQQGREEVLAYPTASYVMGAVTAVTPATGTVIDSSAGTQPEPAVALRFTVTVAPVRGSGDPQIYHARRIVIATGIQEQLPEIANLRAYYGTALHSCVVCDGYEKTGKPVVLLPHPRCPESQLDAARRLLRRFSPEVLVVRDAVEIVGERAQMQGVRRSTGAVLPVTQGFVLPLTTVQAPYLAQFGVPAACPQGLAAWGVDQPAELSNIGIPGIYAVGEALTGEPQQLVVAAGSGAALVPELLLSLA